MDFRATALSGAEDVGSEYEFFAGGLVICFVCLFVCLYPLINLWLNAQICFSKLFKKNIFLYTYIKFRFLQIFSMLNCQFFKHMLLEDSIIVRELVKLAAIARRLSSSCTLTTCWMRTTWRRLMRRTAPLEFLRRVKRRIPTNAILRTTSFTASSFSALIFASMKRGFKRSSPFAAKDQLASMSITAFWFPKPKADWRSMVSWSRWAKSTLWRQYRRLFSNTKVSTFSAFRSKALSI